MNKLEQQIATILAYYDGTSWQDRPEPDGDPEHRDQLVAELCLAAIGRDRELLALVVREACQRGRAAALLEVVEEHNEQAEGAEQHRAEGDGEITALGPARWRRDH